MRIRGAKKQGWRKCMVDGKSRILGGDIREGCNLINQSISHIQWCMWLIHSKTSRRTRQRQVLIMDQGNEGVVPSSLQGMVKLLSWNTRGLNGLSKQKEVKLFYTYQNVGLVGLLEIRIKSNKMENIINSMFVGQQYYSNHISHYNGRIVVV